jgi:cardiolipin synthase
MICRDQPAWLDFACLVEGEMAKELCILAWKTWKGFPSHMGITPCEKKEIEFDIPQNEQSRVRMRRNDWVRRMNQISSSYAQMLGGAKKEVTILSSYFMPGRSIRSRPARSGQARHSYPDYCSWTIRCDISEKG